MPREIKNLGFIYPFYFRGTKIIAAFRRYRSYLHTCSISPDTLNTVFLLHNSTFSKGETKRIYLLQPRSVSVRLFPGKFRMFILPRWCKMWIKLRFLTARTSPLTVRKSCKIETRHQFVSQQLFFKIKKVTNLANGSEITLQPYFFIKSVGSTCWSTNRFPRSSHQSTSREIQSWRGT